MSVSLGVSTRAGKILWKDPLASVLEVIGLAATGLEAEQEEKAAGRSSVFSSLRLLLSV